MMEAAETASNAVGFRRTIQGFAAHVSAQLGDPWIPWPYLQFICNVIMHEMKTQPDGARIVFNTAPRHGKSHLVSRFLPAWFLENYPKLNVILTSYAAELAADWGRKVRDIFLGCPELWTKVGPGAGAVDRWSTTEGGGMLTAGVGGGIIGRGGNCLIIDDPCKNWQDANSPTKRAHERNWFNSTFYTRCEPRAHIIVLMQRWTENDLTGYLTKEHGDDWLHITLPAIAEEDDVLGRKVGEPLCPQRYDLKRLEKRRRAVGSRVWAGLYQQHPVPDGGNIIKSHWLNYYDKLPRDVRVTGISVDAAFEDFATSDFVAIQVWGELLADYYLLDQLHDRMDFVTTAEAIKRIITKWPAARARWIERKANGSAIISVLKKKVPGLIPIEPQGSKEARLQAVSPLFEAGNVWLPKDAPWLSEYVTELTTFPGSKHDDSVDATSQALLKMSSRRRLFDVQNGGYEIPLF